MGQFNKLKGVQKEMFLVISCFMLGFISLLTDFTFFSHIKDIFYIAVKYHAAVDLFYLSVVFIINFLFITQLIRVNIISRENKKKGKIKS